MTVEASLPASDTSSGGDNERLLTWLLHPRRTALLVVDVQNDYCSDQGALASAGLDVGSVDGAVDVIEELADAARRSTIPVVFLKMEHSPSSDTPAWVRRSTHPLSVCRSGTWGANFYRKGPDPSDHVVVKHRYSGFVDTSLAELLERLERTTLVITGTATNVCVESTARHATMLDFDVVVVEDGVASPDPDAHVAALANLERFFGRVVPASRVMSSWNASGSAEVEQ